MQITIREATAHDHPAILNIASGLPDWFTPDGLTAIERDLATHHAWVAVERARVVAFATLHVTGAVAHISWIAVTPSHHRRGIGRQLVDAAAAQARSHNCATLEVETLGDGVDYPPYEQTRAFYHALGFEDHLVERQNNPQWPERLVLRRAL